MKRQSLELWIFLVFSSMQIGFSQSKVEIAIPNYYSEVVDYAHSTDVQQIKLSKAKLTKRVNDKDHVTHVEYIDIDNSLWNGRSKAAPNTIALSFEFKGDRIPLILKRRYIRSSEYHLTTSDPQKVNDKAKVYYYNGIVEGDYNSWATMAVVDGQYKILVASEVGNIEINKIEKNTYAAYESKDLVKLPEYKCHTADAPSAKPDKPLDDSRSVGSDCVELYIECDNQSYLDNGSSVANTEAWALAIMNDVATIYNTIDVPLVVNNVFVWNSQDPYSTLTSIQAVRDSFVHQIENTYDARVAQLFSTKQMGGGLAYGLGGLCGSFPDFPGPYSIATSLESNYTPYPNYSFTVNVVAHELGHVFGARHTHACVWGTDFDSQIDDCGNIYAATNGDQPEGQECFDELNPILPTSGGTIMSFCNLAGGGIDLANGFGSEVGDYIFDKYTTAPCATGGACASIPPTNDDCVNAIELPANGVCSFISYDNILATSSGITAPSCGMAGDGLDVWFQFTATFTDLNLEFDPVVNQVEDVIITMYSGSCGTLTEELCESGTNEQLSIKLSGLTIGETYYIRVIESESDVSGSFELCLVDEFLPCHPAFDQLVDLYNSTNGVAWTNNTGWSAGAANTNCTPCDWYGITCDNQKNIIGIDLFNNNLEGVVPNSLAELTTLRTLKLMNNDLGGNFPDIWSGMIALEFIDLSNNSFTGTMPTSLGSLAKLNTLYIENNMMDGPLLPEIADLSMINVFWTKNNNFSGCYPDSYVELCDIASVKFTNNPLLPNSGNAFEDFCSAGIGGDADDDGYCLGIGVADDCVDDDNTIYPNAPELCDGKDNDCDGDYDENLTDNNVWLPSSSGNWNQASNWSLGVVPASCQDVIFPASGSSRAITIDAGEEAFARSITIFENNTLNNNGVLAISGSDDQGLILNANGSFTNTGTTEIKNISIHGIQTDGSIDNTGSMTIENLGTDFEVYILPNADFINNGILRLR